MNFSSNAFSSMNDNISFIKKKNMKRSRQNLTSGHQTISIAILRNQVNSLMSIMVNLTQSRSKDNSINSVIIMIRFQMEKKSSSTKQSLFPMRIIKSQN